MGWILKHKINEQHNPFDDIFFGLQLACMDFSGFFEEISEEEKWKII
jgi:hypothetical protein